MKIEEAIKQKKFTNEVQRAQINIIYTAAFLNGVHSQLFKKFDLSPQQYNVLRIVNGQDPEPASVQLINERMIDPSSNVSRIVDKLVQKKLVQRKPCKRDRRQVDIIITPNARGLIENVHKELMKRFEPLESIDDKQLETLNETLDLIRDITEQNKEK